MTGSVTIGITCFNAHDTIARAIRSALAQDWPDLEILIVDDASGDGSADVVETLIAGDPRCRLIRHEANRGPAAARNTVLSAAKGALIAFFDDDDESLPSRVRQQVAAIEAFEPEHPGALVACYAGGERAYPNSHVKALPAIGSVGRPPHGTEMADYLLFYRRDPELFFGAGTPTCALMARRETFAAVGGFDDTLRRVEDVDFAIRLGLAGGWFIGTKESLLIQHATEASDKAPETNLTAEVAVAEKHRAYLQSVGRYHYARQWPWLRYYHFKRQYGRFALQFLKICARNPLQATRHVLTTGPRRLRHERAMNRPRSSCE